jgi:hypothetical protein
MREISLGSVFGLRLSARVSALAATVALWLVFVVVGLVPLRLGLGQALVGALVAVGLHWVADLVHQFGHTFAARTTGYPPQGIQLWFLLTATQYPEDEPSLPATTHIRRAIGGPTGSLAVSAVALVVALALRPIGGLAWWLALFFLLDNFFVLALGSLLPLGFTDGSTLLRLAQRR